MSDLNNETPSNQTVLVLGATGYVGGRLIPRLLEAGYQVRAASRSLTKLKGRPWASHANIQLHKADVLDKESLQSALSGCSVAYYLVHSMNPRHKDFAEADRQAAQVLVEAAEETGLERIIYLSGLGEESPDLSKHLRSRAEVSQILQKGSVPVTTLRASMIIGSGSASFEILRYLVERLPIMVTPRWVATPTQPIAIRNVLTYLLSCLTVPETTGKTFDIGGPEVVTYRQLMQIYQEEAKLPKRWIVPVPVFTPKLSSYWIHLVTPVQSAIARPLAEGLRNPAVCKEHAIRDLIPQDLLTCREAIHLALGRMQAHDVETHWTDAGALPPVETVYPGDPNWSGGPVYKDQRQILMESSGEDLWEHVVRIGGETGWYYGNWLWRLRGTLDQLFGGVGYRRGRRDVKRLYAGDALDFWRVWDVTPNRHLKLYAEMKLPGEAILDFELQPQSIHPPQTLLIQTAWFIPHGLGGMVYWYLVMPFHNFIFNGLLRGLGKASGHAIIKGPYATLKTAQKSA